MSLLPLVQNKTGITHIILAAIHLNEKPGNITLNDHPPHHDRFKQLWHEVHNIKHGHEDGHEDGHEPVKVMGMLGGAAKGSFTRLNGDDDQFRTYYTPLLKMIKDYSLDGLDLDVEEEISLSSIVRLIKNLKRDLGDTFIITLAPVATALLDGGNLSGFNYRELEETCGPMVDWYNTQFYNGWGPAEDPNMYNRIICQGWCANRVVLGLLTNSENGSGFVPLENIKVVLAELTKLHPYFGGVMGWEYFNAMPDGIENPWKWAKDMTHNML